MSQGIVVERLFKKIKISLLIVLSEFPAIKLYSQKN
nr:MAG TPA: hypothetical protein [Caudoviricetes sp.]